MDGRSASSAPPQAGRRDAHVAQAPDPAPARRRGPRAALYVVLAVGLGFAGLLGVRVKQAVARRAAVASERAAAEKKESPRERAATARPKPMKWTPRVDVTGTLEPWRVADVGFETSGRLVRVAVSVGDTVTAGKELAVLDAQRAVAQVGQAESQVHSAQANLALAQDNLRRTEALVASKSIPEAQAEQARQQVAIAKAQLDGANASTRLAQTGAGLHSIASPFAGIVTKAPTGIGSVVNAGVPLVHVEDTSRFRLRATIGEEDVPLVAVGSLVHVVYRDHEVSGKVIAVVPSLDQATRRAPVEIEVPNEGSLLAWGFVRARIDGAGEIDAVRIPAAARRPGSQDEVVKVERAGDRKQARVVRVSFVVDADGSLVVQRGLTPSDEVLLSPSPELHDGDPLDVP
jgi:RND family efflux transporter MFP subunit